ncbi:putative membrane-anchored protein [Bacillus sp. JUb91]|nr:putative membrane-anchored protein [Bacillus sp. JUb91]
MNQHITVLTEMNSQYSDMLMDIGIYKVSNEKEELLLDSKNGTAILLLEETIRLEWEGTTQRVIRTIFD